MRSRISRSLIFMPVVLFLIVAGARGDDVRKSVVKVFSTKSPPNMFRPWEVTLPTEVTGSGVVIEDRRILTSAHVVSYAQQIYIQPEGSSDKLDATVEFLSEDCDLATLTVDDPEMISDIQPVPLADDLPALQDKVNVLGYPTGGDSLSVTEGVVSRIEYVFYQYETDTLCIQVDAAINPGNSGGPGIVSDKITGIVFARFIKGEAIGYLIPAEVIRHFLADWTADKVYDGFPRLDITEATLENPSLRKYLEFDREQTGVVVHEAKHPPAKDLLRPWDVIMACDGVNIDNLGMVPLADGIRVNWGYLVSRKKAGSTVKLTVLREQKQLEVELPTITRRDLLVRRMASDRPTYFIYGGLVFSPVTSEMISSIPAGVWAAFGLRGRLLCKRVADYRESPDEELVVTCCKILPHKITKGYDVNPLSVVTHVNDQPVKNLRHLIKLIKESTEAFIVFRFEDDREEKIVLDPDLVEKHNPEILRNNIIPSACSDDLKDVCP